mgnify:FL=1
MIIREEKIEEKNKWNTFVSSNEGGSFIQSWEWADFMATQKEKIWRLVVENENEWLAVIFLFKSKLKFGQALLYAPRGPVIGNRGSREAIFKIIIGKIDELAKSEKAMNFMIDPYSEDSGWCRIFDELGFVKSDRDIQPRHTLILDIREPEEELLKQMHQKTRYNIQLAKKKGVEVSVDNDKFKEFYELLKKTEKRQGVEFFGQDYFKHILQLPFVKLYLAVFEGKIVAANIMIFWNHLVTYLFGASDHDFRAVMAPHLLQWQAIKDAKEQGAWFYDFWGAAPKDIKGREEKWFGFTKFKMGFSPEAEITEYVGTYEKNYSPIKLGLYRYIQRIYK